VIEIPEKRADAHKWLLQFKEIKENWLDEVVAERTGSERQTANLRSAEYAKEGYLLLNSTVSHKFRFVCFI
jgi:hypothetical protein